MGQFIFGTLIGYLSFSEAGLRLQKQVLENLKKKLEEEDVCNLSASETAVEGNTEEQ